MRLPRSSGILLHPTSLPGPHGSGDLGPAAYHFVDWLASAGQRLWQVLPLGGIGPGNSPYMSPSAFAGNVLLIDLGELQSQGWLDAADLEPAPGLFATHVDYGAVTSFRMERLARAAARFAASASEESRAAFDTFCESHRSWLDDYALFMALSEAHEGVDWCDWAPGLALRRAGALATAHRTHAERVAFWRFCQWSFFRQWAQLRAYAARKGVKIVGDAPIFIAHHSADVWARPELFELDPEGRPTVVAGVPPDFFSATGQRWGNPLYRWSAHAAEGYAWWIERLQRTFELVDIVRIDHFRGFAAHWEIPASEPTAVNGRWVPGPGAALFEAVQQALGTLPVLAEDLGVITPDVEALRRRFEFPGMLILQFAFGGDAANRYLPHHHEHDAVVYTGTHDNDTVAGWWAGASDTERHFARGYFGVDGHDMPWTLIRAACMSIADTAIHPLQDVLCLGGEHRMNRPGADGGCWRWRFQWNDVHPWHGRRLAEFCRLYGRTPAA
ncbi:4-alpha-glucanotransferase [Rubrivivax gelatinosus]|uniref:4-alpha-glucanotransferase n=1 Tax=Rubrivivax gelatinosus TaxID=28068 RepID=UPI0002E678D2|nr:4-alpha-glucanotransferase [Rubrivivax gelatinosus]MBG6082797.1 4-alpha-glucanotransferase [Rubrivivax gelatinosus]